jgi:primosomal protein N' (replication factor Y)
MKQAEILVPTATPRAFDYAVPEGMTLAPGDIVSVPLGKKQSLGVVWGEGKADIDPKKIRPVAAIYEFSPLSKPMREFIDWVAWYTLAPRGMVLKMVFPVQDIGKEGRKKITPAPVDKKHIQLAKLSATQEAACTKLRPKLKDGFSVTLLDGVTGSGKTEVYFDAIATALRNEEMKNLRNEEKNSSIPQFLNSQILVLLPEIALSVQWLKRFEERFGFKPHIWNSEITPATRRITWQAIVKGEARIVVGARSALFLPYKNLSLIVVDEEHDASYKQEEGVIYHARDMAVARGRFEKLPVILVSATPSLESYYNARQGKYDEVILPVRHAEAVMPDIEMVDMRRTPIDRGAFVSQPLRQALAETIANGHQAMLFLNRRGYAPLVLCRTCGHRFQCPDCSSWMVMHRSSSRRGEAGRGASSGKIDSINRESPHPNPPPAGEGTLKCHHCNFHQALPDTCPACGVKDNLHACGPGVERIYEEVKKFLPQARLGVMASDAMGGYRDLSDIIHAMIDKKIDLLIGTQMIAKGHHFADLGVVGVIDADLGLGGGDLRASERTYQLLHQLSGRAGREQVRGKVYLQSFCPEHPVMQALLSGDRETFLSTELEARRNAKMPPFSRLAAIIVEGVKEEQVIGAARQIASSFPITNNQSPFTLLGPAPAPLYRLRNHYRMRLLLKADRAVNVPDTLRQWLASVRIPSSIRVRVDVDPVSFL